jgi:flagellar hook-associated protein 3 FlgL
MAEITRISTLSIYNTAINNSNKQRASLANLQDQLSSGLKGRDFKAYNGQVEQLVGLEKEVKRTKMYLDNNAETVSRLTTVEKSLEQAYNIAEEAKKLFTLRNNGSLADNIQFDVQAENFLLTMAKELNINVSGRYLFGGTNTEFPPVKDDPVPPTTTIGTPDDSYYLGSKENVVTRVQDNIDLEYDIRADDPAFQKYFAALWLGLEGHQENDITKINNAQDMLDESLKGINTLVARVQNKRTNLDSIMVRQKDVQLYFTSVVKDISNADVVAVASRVAIEEATLQATFQAFSRISSLNLSDFLR